MSEHRSSDPKNINKSYYRNTESSKNHDLDHAVDISNDYNQCYILMHTLIISLGFFNFGNY